MFTLILSLLYLTAQASYSRMYLRDLKRVEDERIKTEFIYRGITVIKEMVFNAAKYGLLKLIIPLPECKEYNPNELPSTTVFNEEELFYLPPIDKDVCETIVNGIKKLVIESFPDSDVVHDTTTRKYTIQWD